MHTLHSLYHMIPILDATSMRNTIQGTAKCYAHMYPHLALFGYTHYAVSYVIFNMYNWSRITQFRFFSTSSLDVTTLPFLAIDIILSYIT